MCEAESTLLFFSSLGYILSDVKNADGEQDMLFLFFVVARRLALLADDDIFYFKRWQKVWSQKEKFSAKNDEKKKILSFSGDKKFCQHSFGDDWLLVRLF